MTHGYCGMPTLREIGWREGTIPPMDVCLCGMFDRTVSHLYKEGRMVIHCAGCKVCNEESLT